MIASTYTMGEWCIFSLCIVQSGTIHGSVYSLRFANSNVKAPDVTTTNLCCLNSAMKLARNVGKGKQKVDSSSNLTPPSTGLSGIHNRHLNQHMVFVTVTRLRRAAAIVQRLARAFTASTRDFDTYRIVQ